MFKLFILCILNFICIFNPISIVCADNEDRDEVAVDVYYKDTDFFNNDKKEVFVSDFIKALSALYKADVYSGYSELDRPRNKSYIEVYSDYNEIIIFYNEFKNGKYNLNRSFYCNIERYKWYGPWCGGQLYYVNGKQVDFNDSLKGKDPIYDWIMKNLPEDRRLRERASAFY